MTARFKLGVLIALSLAQLGAAAWSIARYETILATGTTYKMRTAAIDPADPFRGRYVVVQPSITLPLPIAGSTEQRLQSVQSGSGKAFVRLAADADGFARAAEIVAIAPQEGDYLEITAAWPTWRPKPGQPSESEMTGYSLRFSFDRYYMTEAAAPTAQERFTAATVRNAETKAWLTVRVKNGLGVIEGLFIDGVPIEELVRR